MFAEQYLWLKGDWHPLDKILSVTSSKEGWHQVCSEGHTLTVSMLSSNYGWAKYLCSINIQSIYLMKHYKKK